LPVVNPYAKNFGSAKALQNAGFDVMSYDNGLSAYQRLRVEPFELLLTDIVMPEMDAG
jgi:two-component system cell cycle response regulator CpdR